MGFMKRRSPTLQLAACLIDMVKHPLNNHTYRKCVCRNASQLLHSGVHDLQQHTALGVNMPDLRRMEQSSNQRHSTSPTCQQNVPPLPWQRSSCRPPQPAAGCCIALPAEQKWREACEANPSGRAYSTAASLSCACTHQTTAAHRGAV
jgi:hypothetical protein